MHTEEISTLFNASAGGAIDSNRLAQLLNELILHDFEALVRLLYRVDVPEQKLRHLLHQHQGADAGTLLASLLIARHIEKTQTHKQLSRPAEDIPDADRW